MASVKETDKYVSFSEENTDCPFCLNPVKVEAKVCSSCGATVIRKYTNRLLYILLLCVSFYLVFKISAFTITTIFGDLKGYATLGLIIVLIILIASHFVAMFVYKKFPNSMTHRDKRWLRFKRITHD